MTSLLASSHGFQCSPSDHAGSEVEIAHATESVSSVRSHSADSAA